MTFEEMIDKLLDNGIEIRLLKLDGVTWYDLNTGMKSRLWICKRRSELGVEFIASLVRYGPERIIGSWNDLMQESKDCLCGSSYMHPSWLELLLKEGYLKASTKTVITYEQTQIRNNQYGI